MAQKLNFKIDQGTDYSFKFSPFPNTNVNLTGYRGAMQVRRSIYADEAIDTLTTTNGRLVFDVPNGKITVLFPNEATVKYSAKEYVYDIEIISPDARIYRVLEGKIYVSAEVTRVKLSSL